MGLRDFLSAGKDVIEALKDIATSDEQIQDRITQSGGIISLVGIGLELYDKYKDRNKTPAQKAFSSLLQLVFRTTQDLLKDVKENEKHDFDYNWKTMQDEIFEPFEDNPYWTEYLPNNPVVKQFKSKIIAQLRNQNYDSEKIDYFTRMFNIQLEANSGDDEGFKEFDKYRKIHQQYTSLVNYLESIENMNRYSLNLDGKPLSQYYVDHDAIASSLRDTWTIRDEVIRKNYVDQIKNETDVLEEQLLGQNARWYLVIGASFGIGKTSLVRIIASKYATNFLDNTENPELPTVDNYIPVVVFLRNGLRVEYGNNSLENLINSIVAPPLNEEAKNRNILMIFDGLDEYDSPNNFLMDKIDELHGIYPNMKFLITTRLQEEVLKTHKIMVENYVRLLQFTKEQLNNFFYKYGVKLNGEILTYDMAAGLNLPVEEMTKPLFAWIFSFLEMYTDDPELKIESKKGWTDNMTKSWIYMLFFHHIVRGKYKDVQEYDLQNLYTNEKELLRIISALTQIHGEELTEEIAQRELSKFQLFVDNSDSKLSPTISDLSYFFYSVKKAEGKKLDFVHKTFKEYLLAEYYLESILQNKLYRLNAKSPTNETIQFLAGLVDLLKESKSDNAVKKYMFDDETSLLKSFRYDKDMNSAIEEIEDHAYQILKEENITFFSNNNEVKGVENFDGIWCQAVLSRGNFENLWMHRWIALYTLQKLGPAKRPSRDILGRLIRFSSNTIPGYVKHLSQVDLSDEYLPGVILSGADLSYATLTHSNLSGSNLSYADLSKADFMKAHLPNSNLTYTKISEANFSYAFLSRTTIADSYGEKVNFTHANLSDAYIARAKLAGAILSEAILYHSNLDHSDLTKAILTRANLSESNLYGVNFSGANLSGANLDKSFILDIETKAVITDEKTTAHNILLVDDEYRNDYSRIRDALYKIHENLRRIILRDNPHLQSMINTANQSD
jgi:uncharacterized protein YjbI with pentapeptide repeats